MKEYDAKGLSCPEPVMMTAQGIAENPNTPFAILVDNAVPRDNIVHLANRKKLPVSVTETDGTYRIVIG